LLANKENIGSIQRKNRREAHLGIAMSPGKDINLIYMFTCIRKKMQRYYTQIWKKLYFFKLIENWKILNSFYKTRKI